MSNTQFTFPFTITFEWGFDTVINDKPDTLKGKIQAYAELKSTIKYTSETADQLKDAEIQVIQHAMEGAKKRVISQTKQRYGVEGKPFVVENFVIKAEEVSPNLHSK